MKKFSHILCLMMGSVVLLTSCLSSSDSDATLYDDAAVTSFTLGTLRRNYHPASNPDTTLTATVTGSLYRMTIDHFGGQIYNQDSLPLGTVPKAICTLTTVNGGLVGLKGLDNDIYAYYNGTDSVDFTQPRIFRVVSTDGTYYRNYEVRLNISTQTSGTFGWQRTATLSPVAALTAMKMVAAGERLLIAGQRAGQTVVVGQDGSGAWTELTTGLGEKAWRSAVVKDTTLYILTDGQLQRSKDGQSWETVSAAADLQQLLGAGTKELFALGTDGRLKASRDEGLTWADERLDEAAALLPNADMACVSFDYQPTIDTDLVLLAGTDTLAADTVTTQWRKLSCYVKAPEQSQWVFMPKDPENRFKLPRQQGLSMAVKGTVILAAGSGMTVYESRDQGISWQKSSTYALPAGIEGKCCAVTATKGGTLWLLSSSGQLWKGTE